ncbi:MAG TPA: FMN-binding protein [Spirochaetia bacterium]|nr:FMN-binding protein [Spirochaetia bacterium]
MKEEKQGIFIVGMKLFLICAIAAVSLGALNEVTEPAIFARKAQEEAEALKQMVPDDEVGERDFVKEGGAVNAYYTVKRQGALYGYVLDLRGRGYGGELKILAAYKKDGEILSARLLDNQETPGLGKKAEDPKYMLKFKGTGTEGSPVPTSKEMLQARKPQTVSKPERSVSFRGWFLGPEASAESDSVTGATITFMGVSRALADGAAFIRTKLGGK